MASKLPKHHKGQVRKTVSLSISVPIELEEYMNRAAAFRGMNRSQYVSWLIRQHAYIERGQLPPAMLEIPPVPEAPSRVKRKAGS